MGLDMYAFATTEKLDTAVDFPEPDRLRKLHYWRKHPNLHGWMQNLYQTKGGRDKNFNLSAVTLNSTDLDRLEAAIVRHELPETSGFFFGESDESRHDDDLAFVRKARVSIEKGETVFYVAWW